MNVGYCKSAQEREDGLRHDMRAVFSL